MLALIVINPPNFQALKVKLCQSMLTPEQGHKMADALRDLMAVIFCLCLFFFCFFCFLSFLLIFTICLFFIQDVEPNLSGKNRDLFTQRLSTFRHSVQSIQNG
jgi:hypothetical protein